MYCKIMVIRNFKYRLYPSYKTSKVLLTYLHSCRELYNSLLDAVKNKFSIDGSLLHYFDLAKLTKENKSIHSQVRQEIAKRISFHLGKINKNKNVNIKFPRYKTENRYKSFTFPQYGNGVKFENDYLFLSKIGKIKVKYHRDIPNNGNIKTTTIKKELNQWFVIFSVELPNENMSIINNNTIILNEIEEYPYYIKTTENKFMHLKCKQKVINNSKLNKLQKKVNNQKFDYLHKLSRKLVTNYSNIIVSKNFKSNNNVYNFFHMLTYKAEEAGSIITFEKILNNKKRFGRKSLE